MIQHNLFNGRLIRLRALEPEDAETLFRFRQDSDSLQHQGQMGWPYSLAELRFRLEKLPELTGQGDNMQLAIETLNGEMVGEINIQLADPKHGTFAVGIALGERAVWGKGYAKEAMLLVLRFMFLERRYQSVMLAFMLLMRGRWRCIASLALSTKGGGGATTLPTALIMTRFGWGCCAKSS